MTPARLGAVALAGLSADHAMARLGLAESLRDDDTSGRAGEAAGIRYRVGAHWLYGVLDADESGFGRDRPLQETTEDAYRRIFALIERERCPHLWRTWNYMADINKESGGLERYRQFNLGRHQAFVAGGRLTRGSVPAACALGIRSGPLTIAFLAGRSSATPLENPRQISAYDYPAIYGPRSPTFSRGALARLPGQELLFVSGTASIVGHRTLHPDDVRGQTRETLANIEALLAAASDEALTAPYRLPELRLRVYVRHAADLPRVRAVVETAVGAATDVAYVEADICRADLLVEIEAIACHPMGHS